MHSLWKTQDFSKIESGPNHITAAHAFVKATLTLGLRAPFVARNKLLMSPNERLNNIILERTIEYNGATSEYPATNLHTLVAGYSEV